MIGYPRAAQIYASLCHWGRYSGFPHLASETPREYGLRLRNRFPSLGREIQVIIEAFNHEVYGEITLPDQQMVSAQFAWRRLRSPAHWPSRLKAWLFRQEDNPL